MSKDDAGVTHDYSDAVYRTPTVIIHLDWKQLHNDTIEQMCSGREREDPKQKALTACKTLLNAVIVVLPPCDDNWFVAEYSSRIPRTRQHVCLMREEAMDNTHFLDRKLSSQVASGHHGTICCIQNVTQVAYTVC